MKVAAWKAEKSPEDLISNYKALLLYGPNEGAIGQLYTKIKHKFASISGSEYGLHKYSYSEASDEELYNLLCTSSLFGGRTVVCLTEASSGLDNSLKQLLESEFSGFLIILAGELTPASSLRKHFENSSQLAAIPFYMQENKNISEIIENKVTKEGKFIENEAKNYLSRIFSGDNMTVAQELEKLLLYSGNQRDITLDMVRTVFLDSKEIGTDDLTTKIWQGRFASACKILDRLRARDLPFVAICRGLSRHYINLYIVKQKQQEGKAKDEAIKSLNPPIFFKFLPIFKQALEKLDLPKITSIINELAELEVALKTYSTGHDALIKYYLHRWCF